MAQPVLPFGMAPAFLVLAVALAPTVGAAGGDVLPFPAELPSPRTTTLTPLTDYECDPLDRFTLLWHPILADDMPARAEMRSALLADFALLATVLPGVALDQLGDIRIAINTSSPGPTWLPSHGRRLGTHVSAPWLLAHDLDADRAGVIEVYNAADYLALRANDPAILLGPLTTLRLRQVDVDTRAAVTDALGRSPNSRPFPAEHLYATAFAKALFAVGDLDPRVGADLLADDLAGCEAVARLWMTTCQH